MSAALEYLENLQGLILYTQKKYNTVTQLPRWLDLPEDTFDDRIKEFKDDYKRILNDEVYENRKGIHVLLLIKDKLDEIAKRGNMKSKKETIKSFKEHLQKLESTERLFSKFEPINYLGLVKQLESVIHESGRNVGYIHNESIVYGTVATRGINACAIGLENGESIIILERDLMSLLHLTAKAIIQSFLKENSSENDNVRFVINPDLIKKAALEGSNNTAIQRFKQLITSYVQGSPLDAEFYELTDETELGLAGMLLYGAEVFVAGHEYGHIVQKHNTNKRKIFSMNPMDGLHSKKWDKEFEADNVGVRILLDSIAKWNFNLDFQYIGAEMFFIIYEIAGKALSIYNLGVEMESSSDSHPPYKERINKLRQYIADYPDRELLADALYFADSLREILEFLWEQSKADIFTLYKAK